MKRIYSLDFLKLMFAYMIALSHFGVKISPAGGTIVQMFFIISGFFLAKKFSEKKRQNMKYNQCDYTKEHIKALYPHYIFSLLILAGYFFARQISAFFRQPEIGKLEVIGKSLYSLIPEVFLLQNSGCFEGGINYPLWQVCTLIISSYFVYGFLCFNEKLSRELIFPAAILMIQVFLKTGVDPWGSVTFFHVPLLRAFSPLCIGVLAYYCTTTIFYHRMIEKRGLMNCVSIISLLTVFVYDDYQNIFLLTFTTLLLIIYDENSGINRLLNKRMFKMFGVFSYAIYLNHAFIIDVLITYFFPTLEKLLQASLSLMSKSIIYLVILTIYSLITLFIVDKYKKHFRKTV